MGNFKGTAVPKKGGGEQEQGHIDAMRRLTFLYYEGNVIPKNENEAHRWLIRASKEKRRVQRSPTLEELHHHNATHDDVFASFKLGQYYENGRHGVH